MFSADTHLNDSSAASIACANATSQAVCAIGEGLTRVGEAILGGGTAVAGLLLRHNRRYERVKGLCGFHLDDSRFFEGKLKHVCHVM